MKRIYLLLLLCVCVALALAACKKAAPTEYPTIEPVKVAGAQVYPTLTLAPPSFTQAPGTGSTAAPGATPAPPQPTRITGAAPLVALDAGHGGLDLGARHFNLQDEMDMYESTITLQIVLKIGAKLEALGYGVYYVRKEDTDLGLYDRFGEDERAVIQARTDLINASGADLVLSVHLNAWDTEDKELRRVTGGTETYYCPDRPFGDRNLRFAELVHQNILDTLARLGDEVSDRHIHIDHEIAYPGDPGHHLMLLGPQTDIIARPSNMPGVLSEPVFITCDREAYLVARDDAQEALADAYVAAIAQYFREYPVQ
jgi:N-acetylmuramoyl-L-alanine amidase